MILCSIDIPTDVDIDFDTDVDTDLDSDSDIDFDIDIASEIVVGIQRPLGRHILLIGMSMRGRGVGGISR